MKNLGVSFSWERAIGLTQIGQQVARKTGIPMLKAGMERKIGNVIIKTLFRKNRILYLMIENMSLVWFGYIYPNQTNAIYEQSKRKIANEKKGWQEERSRALL